MAFITYLSNSAFETCAYVQMECILYLDLTLRYFRRDRGIMVAGEETAAGGIEVKIKIPQVQHYIPVRTEPSQFPFCWFFFFTAVVNESDLQPSAKQRHVTEFYVGFISVWTVRFSLGLGCKHELIVFMLTDAV